MSAAVIWKRVWLVLSLGLLLAGLGWKGRTILIDQPAVNWDALGYIACALALDGHDDEAIHDGAYAAIEAVVSPREFRSLTTAGRYRTETFEDPALFAQQRRFYQGRFLYVAAIWIVSKLGVPLGLAPTVVSLTGWITCALLAFAWLARRLPPWLVGGVVLALSLSGPMVVAASSASPDSVAAVFIVGACFALVERRGAAVGVALLAVGLLARTDTALFGVAVAVLLGLFSVRRGPRVWAPWLGVAAGLVGLSVCLRWLFHARPWWVLFSFITRGMTPNVDEISPDFDVWVWADVVYRAMDGAWGSDLFGYGGLALVGAWWLTRPGMGVPGRRASAALLALAASMGVRFLMFPRDFDRLLAPSVFAVALLLVVAMTLRAQPEVPEKLARPDP